MSLIARLDITKNTLLGVWKMDDSEDELLALYPHLRKEVECFSSAARRMERLSVYALLYELTGNSALVISHNEDGKPYVEGYRVSISHTRGYAAVLVSANLNVGTDIEMRSGRVGKIARRFIREDEWTEDIDRQLLIWSAKETAYKFFSEQHLELFEMRTTLKDKKMIVENMREGSSIVVDYCFERDYVLTWTHE